MLTNVIVLILFVGFWVTILWAVITFTKTLQRIAMSLEQLVRQKEERARTESPRPLRARSRKTDRGSRAGGVALLSGGATAAQRPGCAALHQGASCDGDKLHPLYICA